MRPKALIVTAVLLSAALASAGCGEGLREAEKREPPEWAMYGGNPSRDGHYGEELAPPFAPKWSHRGDPLEGGAAASRERVFFADAGGKVWCLRHDGGELDWVFEGDAPFRGQTPLVHERRVFLVSEKGTLYCLDALGGRRLWQKELGSGRASSAAGMKGRIYLSYGRSLLCFDARNGDLLFRLDPQGASSLTAPALSEDKLFVAADTKELLCLEASTGLVIWRNELRAEPSCPPVATTAGVLIGTSDNHLSLVDKETGRMIWTAHLLQPVGSPPAVSGSRVFVGVGDRDSLVPAAVWCLDLASGGALWNQQTDLYGSLPLSADGAHVYVWGGMVLLAETGRRIMSQQAEGNPLAPPIPYDGCLYVCSPGGIFTCLGPAAP